MSRSASWHGGLAAEIMAGASSGTGTLYRIGMRIWHGMRVRACDTAHCCKDGWAVVVHDARSEQVVDRGVHSGEDDQRQSELLEIVQKVVDRRSPGMANEITKVRAPWSATTYVRKHIDPRVATFCFWDSGQPSGEHGRPWAHRSRKGGLLVYGDD